jgi:hypothetical protein
MSKQAKLALWEQRISAWRGSGLSQRAWCLREGVPPQTFGYWFRRLSSRGAMLPIVVSDAVVAVPDAVSIEVSLGNGVSVRLPSSLPSDVLVHWLQALRAC